MVPSVSLVCVLHYLRWKKSQVFSFIRRKINVYFNNKKTHSLIYAE